MSPEIWLTLQQNQIHGKHNAFHLDLMMMMGYVCAGTRVLATRGGEQG